MRRALFGWLAGLALALALAPAASAARPHGSEILWDRYGVPHIYARSEPDLFHAYGWAQARSHGDLLLRLYGEARGRAAEYFGPDELKSDRWMAVNDVPARSQVWLARQAPAFRRDLEAFAQGVNDYAEAHPEATSEAARRVLPVSAVDVVGHAQRVFQFVYLAPASLADKLPADAVEPKEAPGSNGWAIAPARSADGATMVLMNPHLPWAPDWSTYYEAQLVAPGIDLYGATQIGLPVLRFMFSDRIAFTQTVNSLNGVTFYRLVPAPGGYRFDGKVLPFKTRSVVLKVRQPDGGFATETVQVRESVHGPVIGERDGAPIALRVAGLDRPFAIEQYWRMDLARDFKAYEAALRRMQVPTFNILYGDREGHIQYLYNGLMPRRAGHDLKYWTSTVPGDTSANLWTDYLTYDELPKVTDPASGTVQNSNNPPWDAAWPQVLDPKPYANAIPSDRVSLRMASGIRMLASTPKISYADLERFKWSTHAELADRVLPELLAAADGSGRALARQAAAVLGAWDRNTSADSRGALLFLAWADKAKISGNDGAGFRLPFVLDQPLTTPAGLADPAAAVVALEAAAQEVIATYGALDAPWGQAMRLRGPGVDLPASEGPGRLGVFDVVEFGPATGGARSAIFGSSYSALVTFAGPRTRAKVLMSYGASSQPGSPHRSDQLPLLSRQQLRDALRERSEIEANLELRERF